VPPECIHGLELGSCITCSPKAAPEPPARAPRAPRPPRLRASTPRVAGESAKPIDLSRQRVFHLTHVRNLPAIVETGSLLPRATATPAVDISSPITRELRADTEVVDGERLDSFVPFFLTPDAAVWHSIRRSDPDPRISPMARLAHDFVLIAAPLSALPESMVLADGDGAASLTRFASDVDGRRRTLTRLLTDEERLPHAEALSPTPFPLASATLIGVANEPVRDEVRGLLRTAGVTTKVAVYPPWFARPEAS
jgi:hypothetical protein